MNLPQKQDVLKLERDLDDSHNRHLQSYHALKDQIRALGIFVQQEGATEVQETIEVPVELLQNSAVLSPDRWGLPSTPQIKTVTQGVLVPNPENASRMHP